MHSILKIKIGINKNTKFTILTKLFLNNLCFLNRLAINGVNKSGLSQSDPGKITLISNATTNVIINPRTI